MDVEKVYFAASDITEVYLSPNGSVETVYLPNSDVIEVIFAEHAGDPFTGAVKTVNDTPPNAAGNVDVTFSTIGGYPEVRKATDYLNAQGEFKPISIGGASSASIYMSNEDSAVAGYKKLNYTPDSTETVKTITANNNTVVGEAYLMDDPLNTTIFDAGTWFFNYFRGVSSAAQESFKGLDVFVRHVDGAETLLFSLESASIEDTVLTERQITYTQQAFSVALTDRLGVRSKFRTTRNAATVLSYAIGGARGWGMRTPLAIDHNNTRNKNANPDFQHITAAEKTQGALATGNVALATVKKVADELSYVSKYPFKKGKLLSTKSLAVFDVNFEGYLTANKLCLYTLERNTTNGWYIRIAALKADGTLDTSIGNNGVVCKFQSYSYPEPALINGKRIDSIVMQSYVSTVKYVTIIIDWEIITSGDNAILGVSNEIDETVYYKNAQLQISDIFNVPVSNERVFRNKTSFGRYNWIKDFIVDLQVYGENYDKTTPICIATIRKTNILGGRSYVTFSTLDTTNVVPISTTYQVFIFDKNPHTLPSSINGRQLETFSLTQKNSSGINGTITVDWSVVPSLSGDYSLYSSLYTYETMLSPFIFKDKPTTAAVATITSTIDDIPFKLITSNTYSDKGSAEWLLIYCHGNGQSYLTEPSSTSLAWMKSHKINYACINIQDQSVAPFTTQATGWGNHIAYNRILKLYNYLTSNYNFKKSIILAGGSMGGLTMGQLAYKKPFPITFCLGIGSVPGLEIIWNNAPSRRSAIRNSFGMPSDGSDDANLLTYIQGYDWYKMGKLDFGTYSVKVGFPNVYMLYGIDNTFNVDFGGVSQYNEIRDMLNKSGIYCLVSTNNATSHADPTLYDHAISLGIFEKELGI